MSTRRGFTVLEAVAAMVLISVTGVVLWTSAAGTRDAADESLTTNAIRQVVVAEQVYASTAGTYTSDPADLARFVTDINVVAGESTLDGASTEYSIAVDAGTGRLAVTALVATEDADVCLNATANSLLAASSPGAVEVGTPVTVGDGESCDAADFTS